MIKSTLPFLIFLTVAGCKRDIEPRLLIGSWKETGVINKTGHNISAKMSFLANDSICMEATVDGNVRNRWSGKYTADPDGTLRLYKMTFFKGDDSSSSYSDSAILFEILKLDQDELEIENSNGLVIRHIRY
jgi:hypothetical protein